MHHLYVRDEQSNFLEVENVKVAVPFVSLNQIFFNLENYVFTENIKNVSTIDIGGNFALEAEKNKKYERTPMRFEVSTRFAAVVQDKQRMWVVRIGHKFMTKI